MRKPLRLKYKAEIDYLFLPISLAILIVMIFLKGQSRLEFELIMIGTLIYVSLALLHHHFDKSLTTAITIEYILMAVLVLAISVGFLL